VSEIESDEPALFVYVIVVAALISFLHDTANHVAVSILPVVEREDGTQFTLYRRQCDESSKWKRYHTAVLPSYNADNVPGAGEEGACGARQDSAAT
jgi:hypothetical protein